jgi:hypothetical protein
MAPVSFWMLKSEWTEPEDAIIDTGSHVRFAHRRLRLTVSVIPHYIWTNAHHSFISDETEMGIGGNIVTGRLGWITLRLNDEETVSPPLSVKANLIDDDSMPLILGFEDVIRRIE